MPNATKEQLNPVRCLQRAGIVASDDVVVCPDGETQRINLITRTDETTTIYAGGFVVQCSDYQQVQLGWAHDIAAELETDDA